MGIERIARIGAAAAVVFSILTVGLATSSVVASASVPSCNPGHFSSFSTLETRPGGTTVRLVLTNNSFPTCDWSNTTSYQFLTSSGVPIGTKVSLATSKGLAVPVQPWKVNDTYQVIQNINTEEGVLCNQKQATYVAVTGSHNQLLKVRLNSNVSVCVGGNTKWTSLGSLIFPRPSACALSALKISVGQSDGTAGTIFVPLIFTNTSTKSCTLSGTPHVQPTTGSLAGLAHIFVGPAASVRDLSSSGYGESLRLAPGSKVSVAFGIVETGNFTPSQCVAAKFQSVSVGFKNGDNWWVALASTTCTKLSSTNVSGIVPGITGMAP
jgi:hypothetical protein